MKLLLPVSAIAAFLLCFFPTSHSCNYYCVVSDTEDCNSTSACLYAPCHTLQYYADNSNFTSNTVFHFLEGDHNLSTVIKVTNVANLSLVGVSLIKVLCGGQPYAGFDVRNFTDFRVENISFHNCQAPFQIVGSVSKPHTNYPGTFILVNGSGLTIDRVTFSECSAHCLVFKELQNHLNFISNSLFLQAVEKCTLPYSSCNNIYFYFTKSSNLSIDNCTFLNGQEPSMGLLLEIAAVHVYVTVTNSVFSGGDYGWWVVFSVLTNNFITMSNITILNSALSSRPSVGFQILAHDDIPKNDPSSCGANSTQQPNYLMELSNFNFTKNIRDAFAIFDQVHPGVECKAQYILIKDSLVTENTFSEGSIIAGRHQQSKTLQITLKNVSIISSNTTNGDIASIYLIRMVNVTIFDCTFENNQMTAISAEGSNIMFQGNNTFINNSALNGAGIMLQNSHIYLSNNTNITFADNYATAKGGAMYIDDGTLLQIQIRPLCVLQYKNNIACNINFMNNTAGIAGSSLYWITHQLCFIPRFPVWDSEYYTPEHLFHPFSSLQNSESDPSAISSDPIRICQCLAEHHMPDCSSASLSISAYPGEDVTKQLAVVGTLNGTVPGTIYATIPPSSPTFTFGHLQDAQLNRYANCNNVTYTIYASEKAVIYFYLAPTENSPILNVSVDLQACPIGFTLNNGACNCDHAISREDIRCFINNQSILRPANTWIGFMDNFNETGVVFSEYCPQGYCISHDIYVNSDEPDSQCADNRTGVICGECVKYYSLTLGGQKCSECSNLYVLLLLPLAASGLVLVAVLFVLNLTVTEGSINGLIFYANIVSMSHSSQYFITSSQLYTFIAWLNFDLGIDTCFYNGMDAYAETWLQFVFPLYLWLIIAGVIALCNALPKVFTERGTQNAVKVLATLLLLSYTKLQRTLITIFSFTTLRYPSGKSTMSGSTMLTSTI